MSYGLFSCFSCLVLLFSFSFFVTSLLFTFFVLRLVFQYIQLLFIYFVLLFYYLSFLLCFSFSAAFVFCYLRPVFLLQFLSFITCHLSISVLCGYNNLSYFSAFFFFVICLCFPISLCLLLCNSLWSNFPALLFLLH